MSTRLSSTRLSNTRLSNTRLSNTRLSNTEPEPLREPDAPSGPSTTTTTVLERELVEERQLSEPGDHERFAHYVRKEKILESALTGDPVVALCGKIWLPSRNPDRFPVCPVCKEIHQGLRPGKGGDDGEGDH